MMELPIVLSSAGRSKPVVQSSRKYMRDVMKI